MNEARVEAEALDPQRGPQHGNSAQALELWRRWGLDAKLQAGASTIEIDPMQCAGECLHSVLI